MTGFDLSEFDDLSWELRSVNHRYLELNFKLPEDCRHLEAALKIRAKAQLTRGKIDCTLRRTIATQSQLFVDQGLIQNLVTAIKTIEKVSKRAIDINGLDLLKWPGVLASELSRPDDEDILARFDTALGRFSQTRAREGDATRLDILEKLAHLDTTLAALKQATPEIIQRAQARLTTRFEAWDLAADSERIHQEIVLLTSKADVGEEIERIDAHMAEVRRCLAKGGPVGRRLDFLMQELNREANTLSSKAIAVESTFGAVDMKVAIEQMREQIQNLE
ncbi:MAG: YicC family protein [Gammaproteobacteria bacterium]|nr:YicC family protein [Gammaproteobacteria bacterium]